MVRANWSALCLTSVDSIPVVRGGPPAALVYPTLVAPTYLPHPTPLPVVVVVEISGFAPSTNSTILIQQLLRVVGLCNVSIHT